MSKVDTVIAGLGIALLVAAAAGLLWVQEFADLQDHTFPSTQTELEAREVEVPSGGDASMEWHGLPANTTSASVAATVGFSGQALQGGAATVELKLEAPDGTATSTQTFTFTIQPGSSSAEGEFEVNVTWASVPEAVRAQQTDLPPPLSYDAPLRLTATIQPPSDAPALSQYSFTLAATPTVEHYAAATGASDAV